MIGALVLALQVVTSDPAVVARTVPDTALGVTFRAIAFPDTVVVGQQARYQVAVFVTEEVRERLRRNPEFVPPELRAMLAYDLRSGYTVLHSRRIGSRTYEIHVFERAIFPLIAGTHVIPPAELTYALPLGSSFFSREESHTLRSDVVTLVAVDPPAAGRPPDWSGAVGVLAVTGRVDSHDARAGEPVTLTLRVSGDGNINLLPRPPLSIDWGMAVAAGERVRVDSSSQTVRGHKEFDWLVTPGAAGEIVLQGIPYPFYDPVSRRWQAGASAPETLHVAPGIVASVAGAGVTARATIMPLRQRWRGPLPKPIAMQLPFWLAVLLVPVPAAVVSLRRLRGRGWFRRRDRSAADRLGDPGLSEDDARRAFRRALDERLAFGTESVAQTHDVAHLLRRAGVTPTTAAETSALLAELDAAAFASAPPPKDAQARLRTLLRAINKEAVRAVARVLLVIAAAVGTAASLGSAPEDEPARAFADGLGAWKRGEVASARDRFAHAAGQVARAPDAWANLGVAALAAQDTAAAAQAWQRAARLEPAAADVRAALAALPAPSDGWIAWVPPVRADAVALVALAIWSVGWAGLALALAHASRRARAVAAALVLAGVMAGAAALEVQQRGRATTLAVVRGGDPLRALPALGADPTAQLLSGEVARVDSLTGPWAHVALDGQRGGWIARDRVLDLALPTQ